MAEKQPTSLPSQSLRGFYTSPAKQARVMERHLEGDSKRKIAREEGIDRETVSTILSQEEYVRKVARLQSRALGMGDMALDVVLKTMASGSQELATATAIKLLEGTGIFSKRGLQGTIDASVNRNILRKTPVLLEFQQEPNGFVRPEGERTGRMPPAAESHRTAEGPIAKPDESTPASS